MYIYRVTGSTLIRNPNPQTNIHVIYRAWQAKYGVRIRVAVPQECVNSRLTPWAVYPFFVGALRAPAARRKLVVLTGITVFQ